MKTKILLWSVVSVLTVGIASDTDLLLKADSPQVITLDDGTKLTLLGTTFGYRHAPPHFEKLGTLNWIDTDRNTTVVWIQTEHKPDQWPSYELLVSDQSNTACVNIEESHPSTHVKTGVDIHGFALNAFPRWDKETILRVRPYRGSVSKEQFVMTNPPPGTVANWTPKPLPDTQTDGDLEVTLTKLVAGAPIPYYEGKPHGPTNDPANQCVHLDFNFRQNGQPTTNWHPWPVVTSDAAGNHVRGLIYDYPSNGINPIYPDRIHPSFPPVSDGYYYQPGLWPDQSPWKVRLEFIHRSNFSDEETVTFTNLSVRTGSQQDFDEEWSRESGNTNFPFVAECMVNGVKLKLLTPLLYSPDIMPREKHLSVLIFADPEREARVMTLTLLQATDENGQEVVTSFRNGGGWAGHFGLDFPNARAVKTLNLKLALHKSRFVEFTVKPEKFNDDNSP